MQILCLLAVQGGMSIYEGVEENAFFIIHDCKRTTIQYNLAIMFCLLKTILSHSYP